MEEICGGEGKNIGAALGESELAFMLRNSLRITGDGAGQVYAQLFGEVYGQNFMDQVTFLLSV